jgi:hypothetical protein
MTSASRFPAGHAASHQKTKTRESRDVLRAGLAPADWITVDDTGARHQAKNGFCTNIGNDQFASLARIRAGGCRFFVRRALMP